MLLLTDIDDCALDWGRGFREFVKSKGIPTTGEWVSSWDLGTWMPPELVRPTIDEFNSGPKFGELLPVEGSVEALKNIFHAGYRIVGVTSCSGDPAVKVTRVRNLNEYFGNIFLDVHCIPIGESKAPILSQYPPGSFWVEDKFENAVAGLECGHKSILFSRPHNRGLDHPEVRRFETWKGIQSFIETRDKKGWATLN